MEVSNGLAGQSATANGFLLPDVQCGASAAAPYSIRKMLAILSAAKRPGAWRILPPVSLCVVFGQQVTEKGSGGVWERYLHVEW
jgi:hypothetical protein